MSKRSKFKKEQTRAQQKYRTHWRTKEGAWVSPDEMDTEHILNTLNLCMRNVQTQILLRALGRALAGDDRGAVDLQTIGNNPQHLRQFCIWRWPVCQLMEDIVLSRAGVATPSGVCHTGRAGAVPVRNNRNRRS